MSIIIPEKELPKDLPTEQAVETAYASELQEVASKLRRGLPVLVECDKDLAPFIFVNVRNRLRTSQPPLRCLYLDGRPRPEDQQNPAMPQGLIATMIGQLREAVRGAVERRVVVLPHLDLLTTSQGGLTAEAREVIPLLYENPELVWLGFKDPSFSVPKVIENLFLHQVSLIGINRERLRHLITGKEARKFGREFNPWALYKHVSGVNAARLRKMLTTLEGEDYPDNPRQAYNQLRQATLVGQMEVPNVDLDKDIGGYTKVKDRITKEILGPMSRRDMLTEAEDIKRLEDLIPKGILMYGPPGVGKTLFAKAMATAFGAAIQVVSGPELKSKWVGESEENLRRIFYQARQSAPSIIVFDEIDSFATARGTYSGSGVEHSMVNQLLTEMDGFHKEEMVFVIGTTNFVESVDPALLRPGRFEFHLYIPYPDADDRRAVIQVYNKKMRLDMTDEAVDFTVKRTGDFVVGGNTRYSGDHINALCRAIARIRLREDLGKKKTEPKDVERALTEWVDRPKMTSTEERVLATHEAGHAVAALCCEHSPPVERVTIQSDMQWAFGYVKYDDPAHKYIQTKGFLEDLICVALAAREAEQLILNDLSVGATSDIQSATAIAKDMVEVLGLGGDGIAVGCYRSADGGRLAGLSEDARKELDKAVTHVLETQRKRAEKIIRDNRGLVETLRDLLLEHKCIDAKRLGELMPSMKKAKAATE